MMKPHALSFPKIQTGTYPIIESLSRDSDRDQSLEETPVYDVAMEAHDVVQSEWTGPADQLDLGTDYTIHLHLCKTVGPEVLPNPFSASPGCI